MTHLQQTRTNMQIIEFPPYSVIRNDKAKVSVSNNNILIFKENYL